MSADGATGHQAVAPPPLSPAHLWSAPFRPFFLFGAAYGPLCLVAWGAMAAGWVPAGLGGIGPAAWHGHEMVFGFTAAVVGGFVLTALPSWAGARETIGRPLAILVAVWSLGRAAAWLPGGISPALVAALDLAFFPLLAGLALRSLRGVGQRRYCALLPILGWQFAANLIFHVAIAAGDGALAWRALMAGIYGYMMLFSIVGGLLTPIFTESALRDAGWAGRIVILPWLEGLAIGGAVAAAVSGTFAPGSGMAAAAALLAFAANGARLVRWRGLATARLPLIWPMHLGFAWFTLAFGLRGLADLGWWPGEAAALHAFTVGGLGLMKMGLMSRVALRHTGRPLELPTAIVAVLLVAALAPLVRLLAESVGGGAMAGMMVLAAVAWGLPFAVYVAVFGGVLLRPSLPRQQGAAEAGGLPM